MELGAKKTYSGACAPLCHEYFILACRKTFLISINMLVVFFNNLCYLSLICKLFIFISRNFVFFSVRDLVRDPIRSVIPFGPIQILSTPLGKIYLFQT